MGLAEEFPSALFVACFTCLRQQCRLEPQGSEYAGDADEECGSDPGEDLSVIHGMITYHCEQICA